MTDAWLTAPLRSSFAGCVEQAASKQRSGLSARIHVRKWDRMALSKKRNG
jgi:hypothetical protein